MQAKAVDLGFSTCRVTLPSSIPHASSRLAAWLKAGYAGEMNWMVDTMERRSDPGKLWPEVGSIVLLGINYAPDTDPLANLKTKSVGNISVYARNRDYHEIVKGKLKMLGQWLASQSRALNPGIKVFVDTAPVMEKPLAAEAGLGWQGKHTNLVSREHGSWLFLGCIFTTLPLEPDTPESDHCGTCRACLDICPTNAFPAPYVLDARRCISYLTIEHKGHIDRALRIDMGNRIYGCDDCLAICPWNKFASAAQEIKLQARTGLAAPPLAELASLGEPQFRLLFAANPVKRIGHARFLRNILIAIGNCDDAAMAAHAIPHLGHREPVVRAMAVWAVGRLLTYDAIAELARRFGQCEKDDAVANEWRFALMELQ